MWRASRCNGANDQEISLKAGKMISDYEGCCDIRDRQGAGPGVKSDTLKSCRYEGTVGRTGRSNSGCGDFAFVGINSVAMLNHAAFDAALEATLHSAGHRRRLHQGDGRSYLAESQNQQEACTQRFEHDIAILSAL